MNAHVIRTGHRSLHATKYPPSGATATDRRRLKTMTFVLMVETSAMSEPRIAANERGPSVGERYACCAPLPERSGRLEADAAVIRIIPMTAAAQSSFVADCRARAQNARRCPNPETPGAFEGATRDEQH